MTLFVISKTAVTPWMARESSLSANQKVYLRNSTSTARRELAQLQAMTERRPVGKNKTMLQALPDELAIKSVEAREGCGSSAKTTVGLFENPGSVDEVVR